MTCRSASYHGAFEGLEPRDGKLSSAVLRGGAAATLLSYPGGGVRSGIARY